MAINRATKYPGRFDNPTSSQPEGAFKNRSSDVSQDGSYLEKDWLNDFSAFFSSLLSNAGISTNGSVDEVGASQYFDSIKALMGLSRSWQEPVRVANTVYTNDNPYDIFICVRANNVITTVMTVDGIDFLSSTNDTAFNAKVHQMVIPPNSTYSLTSGDVVQWAELR